MHVHGDSCTIKKKKIEIEESRSEIKLLISIAFFSHFNSMMILFEGFIRSAFYQESGCAKIFGIDKYIE